MKNPDGIPESACLNLTEENETENVSVVDEALQHYAVRKGFRNFYLLKKLLKIDFLFSFVVSEWRTRNDQEEIENSPSDNEEAAFSRLTKEAVAALNAENEEKLPKIEHKVAVLPAGAMLLRAITAVRLTTASVTNPYDDTSSIFKMDSASQI